MCQSFSTTTNQNQQLQRTPNRGSPNGHDHNLAMILAGIVIVFAVCHFFRFFLAFYQVSTVEKTRLCVEKGKQWRLFHELVWSSEQMVHFIFSKSLYSLVGFPNSHFKTNRVTIVTTYPLILLCLTLPRLENKLYFAANFALFLQKKLHLSL